MRIALLVEAMTPAQMLVSIQKFVTEHDRDSAPFDCSCSTGLPLTAKRDRFGNCPNGYLVVCVHEARKIRTVAEVITLLEKRRSASTLGGPES
jgi:hypothetical protein